MRAVFTWFDRPGGEKLAEIKTRDCENVPNVGEQFECTAAGKEVSGIVGERTWSYDDAGLLVWVRVWP